MLSTSKPSPTSGVYVRPWDLRHEIRLLKATPEGEDPVALLQAAAQDHLPVHPGAKDATLGPSQSDSKGKYWEVPEPEKRPSIEDVILEIEQQEWYKEQITYKRVMEAKEGHSGLCISSGRVVDRMLIMYSLLGPAAVSGGCTSFTRLS